MCMLLSLCDGISEQILTVTLGELYYPILCAFNRIMSFWSYKCKRDLAESKKSRIRMRNEATTNSQLQVTERSQSDIYVEEKRKSSLDEKGVNRVDWRRERDKEDHGQIAPAENKTWQHHSHTHIEQQRILPKPSNALLRKKREGTMSSLSHHRSA